MANDFNNRQDGLKLTITGGASGRLLLQFFWGPENKLSLMENLIQRQLPIASSCGGVGGCQKCVIFLKMNDKSLPLISCQITYDSLKKMLEEESQKNPLSPILELSYL